MCNCYNKRKIVIKLKCLKKKNNINNNTIFVLNFFCLLPFLLGKKYGIINKKYQILYAKNIKYLTKYIINIHIFLLLKIIYIIIFTNI